MKANRIRIVAAFALCAVLTLTGSCSAPKKKVAAAMPAPVPTKAPPPPAPPSAAVHWQDAPITPGTWTWRMEGSRSVARFAGDVLVLSCNRNAAAITLLRPGIAEGTVPVTIQTVYFNRTLSGEAIAGPPPVIGLTLPARDTLLDAMAFSRGRFAVETAGLPTLYVPSWPEVSRVIEDCR